MIEKAPGTTCFRAFRVDPGDGAETLMGEVEIDAERQLRLHAVERGYRDFLKEFVETLNAQETFNVKVPPPAGAEMFALYAKGVSRNSKDFVANLKTYVHQIYGVKLVSDED